MMSCAKHVACITVDEQCTGTEGNPTVSDHSEDLEVNGKVLSWMFIKQRMKAWPGLMWFTPVSTDPSDSLVNL
jgi:hypothetical protein